MLAPVDGALAVKLYRETKSIAKTARIIGANASRTRAALVAAGVEIIPKIQPKGDSKCCSCNKATPQLCPFIKCDLDGAAAALASLGATAQEIETKAQWPDGTEHIVMHYFVTDCPGHEVGPLPIWPKRER